DVSGFAQCHRPASRVRQDHHAAVALCVGDRRGGVSDAVSVVSAQLTRSGRRRACHAIRQASRLPPREEIGERGSPMQRPLLAMLLTGLLCLSLAPSARACPACRDAVQAPTTDPGDDNATEDPARLGKAYNHSIYLFVGMPYLLLTGLGLLIYRSYRKVRPE